MWLRKKVYVSLVLMVCLCNLSLAVQAINEPAQKNSIEKNIAECSTVIRASGTFSVNVPANSLVTSSPSLPLEVGESITISAYFSPGTANVDFGFIAPDGYFYCSTGTNGNFNQTIIVDQHGYYTFAIRNNSSTTIAVSGILHY